MIEYPKYVFKDNWMALIRSAEERALLPDWTDAPGENFVAPTIPQFNSAAEALAGQGTLIHDGNEPLLNGDTLPADDDDEGEGPDEDEEEPVAVIRPAPTRGKLSAADISAMESLKKKLGA